MVKEKVAAGIAAGILRLQTGFASYMNAKTATLSSRGKVCFLFFVCLVLGGLSCMVLLNVFIDNKNASTLSKPHSIQIPAHVTEDSLDKKLKLK